MAAMGSLSRKCYWESGQLSEVPEHWKWMGSWMHEMVMVQQQCISCISHSQNFKLLKNTLLLLSALSASGSWLRSHFKRFRIVERSLSNWALQSRSNKDLLWALQVHHGICTILFAVFHPKRCFPSLLSVHRPIVHLNVPNVKQRLLTNNLWWI